MMSDTFGVGTPAATDQGAGTGEPTSPAPDTGAPAEGFQGEATTPPEQGGTEPQAPSYLDPEQYGDYLVKIKVGGEDVELPFREAHSGIMMQRDYTQKTQELAEERRRLQQADLLVAALEQNPQQTLRELAEVYDLDSDAGLAPVQRSPEEQQLRELQQQVQAQQQQYARQMMQTEIAAIRQQDPNVDVNALGNFASQNGLTLSAAHQVMKAQAVLKSQQDAAAAEQRRQAALAASQAHDQGSTQKGVVQPGSGKAPGSLREAWALAKQQLNA